MRFLSSRRVFHASQVPAIFLANLLLAFHYALLLYVNSSYIENYIGGNAIGILYAVGAAFNLALLANSSRILNRTTAFGLLVLMLILELFAVGGLALVPPAAVMVILFVAQMIATHEMLYCLDLYLEKGSRNAYTGRLRTAYLTVSNLMIAVSPLLAGLIVEGDRYWRVYGFSALFLLPLFFVAFFLLRKIEMPRYHTASPFKVAGSFLADKDLRNVFGARFLLDFFFSWMVIYMPIYLNEYVGFSWENIGIIFAIMLLPFVLFEIPVGKLADESTGEKEFMFLGFALLFVFTFLVPFMWTTSLALWAALLFMTRVGASVVEATTDSYFFKKVNVRHDGHIAFYRTAAPLAYILGPAAAVATLYFVPVRLMFAVLAFFMIVGFKFSLAIKDTK